MSNSTKRRRIGSIRKQPNGRYVARITCGVRADGKPRTISKTHDTETEASDWLLAKSVELSADSRSWCGVTLRQLWEAYKASRTGVIASKTMATYAWYMEGSKHGKAESWLDFMGGADVSAITPAIVQRRLDTMASQKAKHAKSSLSSVLSWGVRVGIMSHNPIRGHAFEFAHDDAQSETWDTDPFAAIEGTRDVWGIETTLRCLDMIHGLPLEAAWLACVGGGLRVEEALALRRVDVRRDEVGGRMITRLAVHAARTDLDTRKRTKTAQSRRIVGMLEPFGSWLWYIACGLEDDTSLLCPMSAANQNKRWRGYFEPSTSKHAPKKEGCNFRGRLFGLPYLPLSKMRNTHVTIMAESGVSDAVNALMHGHTMMVERRHYLSPDVTDATISASERFKLVS